MYIIVFQYVKCIVKLTSEDILPDILTINRIKSHYYVTLMLI